MPKKKAKKEANGLLERLLELENDLAEENEEKIELEKERPTPVLEKEPTECPSCGSGNIEFDYKNYVVRCLNCERVFGLLTEEEKSYRVRY